MNFKQILQTMALLPLIIACSKRDYTNPNPPSPFKNYVDSIASFSSVMGEAKDTITVTGAGFTGVMEEYQYFWSNDATFSADWSAEIHDTVHFASTSKLTLAVLDSVNEFYHKNYPQQFYGRNYYFGIKSVFLKDDKYFKEQIVVEPKAFTLNPAYKVLADTLKVDYIAESNMKPGYSLSNDIVEVYSQYFNAFNGEKPNIKVTLGGVDVTSMVKYYVNTVGIIKYQYISLYFKNGDVLLADGLYDLKVELSGSKVCSESGVCFDNLTCVNTKQVYLKNAEVVNP